MDTRVLAAKEERAALLRSLEAKEVLIERYKRCMGLRDFEKEERETKATFAEELKRLGPGEEVDIPVAYGRCVCHTNLKPYRRMAGVYVALSRSLEGRENSNPKSKPTLHP